MAKKKVEAPPTAAPGRPSSLDLIERRFGKGVVIDGRTLLDTERKVHPVCPSVDLHIGGGIPEGSFVILSGESGCGKTTLAMQLAGNFHARGRDVFFCNAENRLGKLDLTGIPGLEPERLHIIGSSPDHIMSAEDYLLAVEQLLKVEEDALIIVDSLSILSTNAELESKDYTGIPPGGSNRLVGNFCRRMAPVIPVRGNVVVGIGHVYSNIGGKTKWAASVPTKAKHAASTRLHCKYFELIKAGEKVVGQKVHWKVERSSLGGSNSEFTSYIRYGLGYDTATELVEYGLELAVIRGSGWYQLPFLGDASPKINGKEKLRDFVAESPGVAERLRAEIMGRVA
jgi:RecA/RadA recombinase